MIEYSIKAFAAWFLGFFPLAEIYVSLPIALVSGLDNASAVFWTVFGNYTPVILIIVFYNSLMSSEKFRNRLEKYRSEKILGLLDKWGFLFILLTTPIVGVWIMTVAVKTLGYSTKKYMTLSFISILGYAIAIVLLIDLGLMAMNDGEPRLDSYKL